MKKLWVLILILCLAFFACDLETDEDVLEAQFEIVSVTQDYYEYLGEWGYVEINYTITNTGSLHIDFYDIYFEVTCESGAVYSDWTCGLNVPVGKTYHDFTYVSVGNNKALSAKISGYELSKYDW